MDDEMRAHVRSVFGEPGERVPRDVVPGRGLTREDLIRQNDQTGWAEVEVQGEIVLDVDGVPNGFGPPTTVGIHRSTVVTMRELEAVGLTPEEVPNLRIMADTTVLRDPPTRDGDG